MSDVRVKAGNKHLRQTMTTCEHLQSPKDAYFRPTATCGNV